MKYEGDSDTSSPANPWKNPEKPGKETGETRKPMNNCCHSNFKDGHQLLLVWKLARYIIIILMITGGTRGVMVIVVGNGHSDTGSSPGRDWLHFT